MKDYSELKRLSDAATPGNWNHYRHGVIKGGPSIQFTNGSAQQQIAMTTGADWMRPDEQCANADFIAAANPAAVLALISENERYLKLIERMVDQYIPLTELEGVPGLSRVVELVEVVAERDRLKTEVEGLRAQHGRDSAELRRLCQARDYARKERDQLKAEVERLKEEYDKAWRHDLNDKNNLQVLAAEVVSLSKDAARYRWLRDNDFDIGSFHPAHEHNHQSWFEYFDDESIDYNLSMKSK